jgi:hypothetical protein
MADFMLLLHAPTTFPPQYGAEELQNMIQRYAAWSKDLSASGRLVGGHKLRDREGRVLKKQNDQTSVMDGPYAEAKEVVGGYFHITADHYDQAVQIARGCPHLDYGGTIEIRAIERAASR